jgi:hypothetical protein
LLTIQRKQEPEKQEPVKVSTQTKSTNIAERASFRILKNMTTLTDRGRPKKKHNCVNYLEVK